MKWLKAQGAGRLDQLAVALFGVKDADACIEKLSAWFSAIGAPITLAQAEIVGYEPLRVEASQLAVSNQRP